MGGHRAFKDALYTQFARIGHALSSPKRIELIDLLSQGEKTVEQLAESIATPLKNTSAHLRVLRHARLRFAWRFNRLSRVARRCYERPAQHASSREIFLHSRSRDSGNA